jgi:shikimate kinase
MMGSGKSTIGRLLAAATGWPFVDNDLLLERATGLTARELLGTRGEGALRAAEAAALVAGLAEPPPHIVAVAAGTIEDARLRQRLRDAATVVWLRADSAALAVRAADADHRPWLDTDAQKWLGDTAAKRAALYESVAKLVVDTDVHSPEEAAALIAERLSLPSVA